MSQIEQIQLQKDAEAYKDWYKNKNYFGGWAKFWAIMKGFVIFGFFTIQAGRAKVARSNDKLRLKLHETYGTDPWKFR